MLTYIRFFLILHLLLTALAASYLSLYFRSHVLADVEALGEQSNLAMAQDFTVTLWTPYRSNFEQGTVTPQMRSDLQRFVQNLKLVGLRVYSHSGVLLFSTEGTLRAVDFDQDAQTLRQNEHPISRLINTSTEDIGMHDAPLDVVRTFTTVGTQGNEIYLEPFTDVTAIWSKLRRLQLLVSGCVVGVSLILMLGLLLIYRKAEIMITELYEKNVELQAKVTSAEEETKQKSQFLAGISHELRTPLNAIIGFSDIIKTEMMGEVKNTKFASYISDIHSSGVHLLSLINDILDFSKAEAGKLELEVEEVNATKLAANCLRLVQPRAESGNVVLVNDLPKDHFVIETDGKKFRQILLNLLSNAVKFTPSGGRVMIAGWQDLATDSFVFQVSDTGIGIAQKDIAKAMAPFGQVDSALSRKYEGTGLGLPITRKFIELMGGKFSIQSEQGKGTNIVFSLPRVFKPGDGIVFRRAS